MEGLLTIVQAEETADAAIRDAQAKAQQRIAALLRERELLLASITPPPMRPVHLSPIEPKLDGIRETAKRNKRRAVQAVLEAIDAAA